MNSSSITDNIANLLILTMVVGIPLCAACRRVKVYDAFVEGAKDGFELIIKIFPFLLGMLIAVGMLRASGAFDLLDAWIGPFFAKLGLPSQVVPLALIRPFSGSASNGILVDIIHHYGGDAFVSHLAATMMGSTETTFYVIALYFGAAGIRRTRHAIPAGLFADFVGIVASVIVCRILLT